MKWEGWGDELAVDIEKAAPEPEKKVEFTTFWVKFFSTSINSVAKLFQAKMRESHDELAARITALEERPVVKYLGTWKQGETYPQGSLVTRKGGLWHAGAETDKPPGDGPSPWTLAVKQGAIRDA